MLSGVNGMVWMEGDKEEQEEGGASSWPQNNGNNNGKEEEMGGALTTFKSMLEAEEEEVWYATNAGVSFSPSFTADRSNQLVLHHPVDSSASCSPTTASVFNNLDPSNHQMSYFLQPPRSLMSPIPNTNTSCFDFGGGYETPGYLETALDRNGGLFGADFGDLGPNSHMGSLNLYPSPSNFIQFPQGVSGFGGFDGSVQWNSSLFNRPKELKPLDNFASVGAQPTLFQKRAALRKNHGGKLDSLNLGVEDLYSEERKRKNSSGGDDLEDISLDGSNFNYDSDDQFLENNSNSTKTGGGPNRSTVTGGDVKGKKKGLPAKNLMAERRRRKKLNDRLYMLRSVVPKISKMDRASILGDAIDYLKELLQKINELHNELESTPPGTSFATPGANMYPPLTPTGPSLRINDDICPSGTAFATPMSSPTGQPARVEVRQREGKVVNIHMLCGCRPGLLLSTLRAMDNLGLDVQQAVISCFNGFVLDVFRAELGEGQEVNPEQIKATLLDSAGFHGMA